MMKYNEIKQEKNLEIKHIDGLKVIEGNIYYRCYWGEKDDS